MIRKWVSFLLKIPSVIASILLRRTKWLQCYEIFNERNQPFLEVSLLPMGITVTNSLPPKSRFCILCPSWPDPQAAERLMPPSQHNFLQTLTPPQSFLAFTRSNGLDISCQISQIPSHKYALEEGGIVTSPSVGSRAKPSRKQADSYYFCYASFWNHIRASSQSHPAEKTDQFSLNRSPRFLWFGNCSLMLSFPRHPQMNFYCGHCCRSLSAMGGVISTANGQGVEERKRTAWT